MIKPLSRFQYMLHPKITRRAKAAMPIVTAPVVAYLSINGRASERAKKIAKEANHLSQPVTDRAEFNSEQLRMCGVKESDIKKYLKIDARPTEEGKEILKAHHRPFKGAPEEELYPTTEANLDDLPDVPQIDEMSEISELDSAIDSITSVAENPLVAGVAAELLPGTRFFKPIKDLFDGDIEKAA